MYNWIDCECVVQPNLNPHGYLWLCYYNDIYIPIYCATLHSRSPTYAVHLQHWGFHHSLFSKWGGNISQLPHLSSSSINYSYRPYHDTTDDGVDPNALDAGWEGTGRATNLSNFIHTLSVDNMISCNYCSPFQKYTSAGSACRASIPHRYSRHLCTIGEWGTHNS